MSQPDTPIRGFPAIARNDAVILILGSMPSEESLRLKQYYAHPRNAFWPIMMEILGYPGELDYSQRIKILIENRIALWDTLKTCIRSGSLDSAIVNSSIETNQFSDFYRAHPGIRAIFFNGQKSRHVYKKLVLPGLPGKFREMRQQVLPSTSPAMASLDREQKRQRWGIILDELNKR